MFWGNGASVALSPQLMAFIPLLASVIIGWFMIMGLTGWLAERKGRDGGEWAVFAFFVGPIALLWVLLTPARPAPAGGPAAALAPMPRIRLLGDTLLELDMAGGIAAIPGELTPRVVGRPGFRLARSATWQWSDGRPMPDEARAHLLGELPAIGRHEGWDLTIDSADNPLPTATITVGS